MNIVYTVFTDNEFLRLAEIMIESLLENTSVDMIYAGIVSGNDKTIEKFDYGCTRAFQIEEHKWNNNRMALKIELINALPLQPRDQVFILDSDLYIKKDVFDWFNRGGDVLITTRPEFFLSANGGVWGFKNNEAGRKFVSFFIGQMQKPTWEAFKKYRIKNAHDQEGRDWWMDQDFLCTVNDHGLPFTCNVKKFHCRTHNCTPSKKGLVECMNNPDKYIIHFKGGLKPIWLEYYPRYKRGLANAK